MAYRDKKGDKKCIEYANALDTSKMLRGIVKIFIFTALMLMCCSRPPFVADGVVLFIIHCF